MIIIQNKLVLKNNTRLKEVRENIRKKWTKKMKVLMKDYVI